MDTLVIIVESSSGIFSPQRVQYKKHKLSFQSLVKKVPDIGLMWGRYTELSYDSTDKKVSGVAKAIYNALDDLIEYNPEPWGSQTMTDVPLTIIELHVVTLV